MCCVLCVLRGVVVAILPLTLSEREVDSIQVHVRREEEIAAMFDGYTRDGF